jgi:hypothetical protein
MKNSTSDHHPSKLECWWLLLVNCALVPFVVRRDGRTDGRTDERTDGGMDGSFNCSRSSWRNWWLACAGRPCLSRRLWLATLVMMRVMSFAWVYAYRSIRETFLSVLHGPYSTYAHNVEEDTTDPWAWVTQCFFFFFFLPSSPPPPKRRIFRA